MQQSLSEMTWQYDKLLRLDHIKPLRTFSLFTRIGPLEEGGGDRMRKDLDVASLYKTLDCQLNLD